MSTCIVQVIIETFHALFYGRYMIILKATIIKIIIDIKMDVMQAARRIEYNQADFAFPPVMAWAVLGACDT